MKYLIDADKTVRQYKHSEKLNTFWGSSDEMCLQLAKDHKEILLSFSLGKDSLAAAFQCLRFFDRVEFVYMYDVPNLEFIQKSVDYYEKFFGKKILQVPAPSFLNRTFEFAYQPPSRCEMIDDYLLPSFDNNTEGYNSLFAAAAEYFEMSKNYLVADGVRAEDTLNRWSSIKKFGGVTWARRQMRVCYDWGVQETYEAIKRADCKLPIDYRHWGRTFDGIDYKFLKDVKTHFPNDFQKLKNFYPFIELELLRYENPTKGTGTKNYEREKYLEV